MIKHAQKLAGFVAILFVFAVSADAWAGTAGYVDYGPPSHAVPVLSDAMLVVLGFLFSIIAYRVLRASPGGKPLAVIAALAIAALSVFSGTKVIQEAWAAGYSMATFAGGTVDVGSEGNWPVFNNSGQDQQIINVRGVTGCTPGSTSPNSPQCTQGLVVPNTSPSSSCYVNFTCGGT